MLRQGPDEVAFRSSDTERLGNDEELGGLSGRLATC